MIIALDYDKTYTADPHMWDIFISVAKERGHKVICITMRYPNELIEIQNIDKIHYTSRKAKLVWAKQNDIKVDIWIDDKPGWLFDDAPSAEI